MARPLIHHSCCAVAGIRRVIVCLAGALALAGWAADTSAAQSLASGGDIRGSLRDQSGGALAGVTVAVVNEATGLSRVLASARDGTFLVIGLPVGSYRLEATLAGFEPLVVPEVPVTLGASTALTLTLKIHGVHSEVTVEPTRDLADPQRPGVGELIQRDQLDGLPIGVRNFLTFSLLTPTASPDRTPQQGASRTSGLVFAGQRPRANNILVDGLDNNDEVVGSVRATFSQDAVQEFQVLAQGYSAEFGKATGGVVNIVTRSGTNRPAGGGFFMGRNTALTARNYFEQYAPDGTAINVEKAPYSQYQVGVHYGGPIVRDRAFLFGAFERLGTRASQIVTIDDRTPVLSPFQPTQSFGTAADILHRAGFAFDTGHVPYHVDGTEWLVKYDQFIADAQRLSLSVTTATALDDNVEPFGGLVAKSRAASLDSTDWMVSASHNSVFSSPFVNELRGLVARRDQVVRALDPSCGGSCDREDQGGPTLEVQGVANVGRQRFTPTPRDNIRYQVVDTFSYLRGAHSLKAGVDGSFVHGIDQALPLHFGGRYIFGDLPAVPGLLPAPVSSIQAVALGLPAAYVQGYGFSGRAYNAGDLALFGEDTWRVRPDITLRAGLRYQTQFWPGGTYDVRGGPSGYTFPANRTNFAPRVGATWTPGHSDRTVVRAAYGIYYANIITSIAGIARYVDGNADGVRTLVLTPPKSFAAWAAPGHRLDESTAAALAGGQYPSVTIAVDPGLETPHAHHTFVGIDRRLGNGAGAATLSAGYVLARSANELGTIDYNPILRDLLGAGRRPLDVNAVVGTSASVLQYTSYGRTSYHGLTVSLTQERLPWRGSLRVAYTLSKAEDETTDFQSAFVPQNNGLGRDPTDPLGLPLGFNPESERGPALHDQRHRLVASGIMSIPGSIQAAAILVVSSGTPFNILVGRDLDGDGDGGSAPVDRARRNPLDAATTVTRNSGRLPAQATLDVRVSRGTRLGPFRVEAMLDIFNLFNRTNFTDVQNIFGIGAFPSQPSATYGQFTQAASGRQIQLGIRVTR